MKRRRSVSHCCHEGAQLSPVPSQALLEGQKKHWSAVTPMGRLGEPGELNGLAVFLASDASAFVTGAEILADVSWVLCAMVGRGGEGDC